MSKRFKARGRQYIYEEKRPDRPIDLKDRQQDKVTVMPSTYPRKDWIRQS